MKHLLGFFLLIISFSCKKDNRIKLPEFDEIFQVQFNLDGIPHSVILPKSERTPSAGFTTSANASNTMHYFASGAGFSFTKDSYFMFEIGTGYANLFDETAAIQAMLVLFEPGLKVYDICLGTGCSQYKNRVRLTFQDEQGVVWSSNKTTGANPAVDQAGSSFEIIEKKEVSTYPLTDPNRKINAVIIKAKFNCILFERDGTRTKTITNGSFTALAA